MTLAAAVRSWFVGAMSFSGVGALVILAGTVTLKMVGRDIVIAPIWLAPALTTAIGAVLALPVAIAQYRHSKAANQLKAK